MNLVCIVPEVSELSITEAISSSDVPPFVMSASQESRLLFGPVSMNEPLSLFKTMSEFWLPLLMFVRKNPSSQRNFRYLTSAAHSTWSTRAAIIRKPQAYCCLSVLRQIARSLLATTLHREQPELRYQARQAKPDERTTDSFHLIPGDNVSPSAPPIWAVTNGLRSEFFGERCKVVAGLTTRIKKESFPLPPYDIAVEAKFRANKRSDAHLQNINKKWTMPCVMTPYLALGTSEFTRVKSNERSQLVWN